MPIYTLKIATRERGESKVVERSTEMSKLRQLGNKKLRTGEAKSACITDDTGKDIEYWSEPIVTIEVTMPGYLWRKLDGRTRGTIESSNALLVRIVNSYLNQFEDRDYTLRENMGENPNKRDVHMTEDDQQAIDTKVGNSREARDSFFASAVARYFYAYG